MFPYGRRRKKNKFIFAEISDTEAGFPTAQTPPGPQLGGRPLRRRPRAPPGPTAAGGRQLPRACHIGNGLSGPGSQPRPAQGDSSPAPPRRARPSRREGVGGRQSPVPRAPAAELPRRRTGPAPAPYLPLSAALLLWPRRGGFTPAAASCPSPSASAAALPALLPAPARPAPPRHVVGSEGRGRAARPGGPCCGRSVERGRHGGGAAASSPRSPGSGSQRGSVRTWQPRSP